MGRVGKEITKKEAAVLFACGLRNKVIRIEGGAPVSATREYFTCAEGAYYSVRSDQDLLNCSEECEFFLVKEEE